METFLPQLAAILIAGLVALTLLCIRRPWAAVVRSRLGVVVVVTVNAFALVAVFVLFTQAPHCGDEWEYTGLSYEQYRASLGLNGLDPVGATDISFRSHKTIDSYDIWLSMRLPPAAYKSLLAQMSLRLDLEDSHFASYDGKAVGPVRKFTHSGAGFPGNWPKPEKQPPAWWEHPDDGSALHSTCWELRVDAGPYSRRAKGWYWLYNPDAAVLSIWEWNRQHLDLGWGPAPADRRLENPKHPHRF